MIFLVLEVTQVKQGVHNTPQVLTMETAVSHSKVLLRNPAMGEMG